MRMLWSTYRYHKRDKIKNEDIWDKVEAISMVDKMQREDWYDLKMCREGTWMPPVKRCEGLILVRSNKGRNRLKNNEESLFDRTWYNYSLLTTWPLIKEFKSKVIKSRVNKLSIIFLFFFFIFFKLEI